MTPQIVLTTLLFFSGGVLALITARWLRIPTTLSVLLWGMLASAVIPLTGIDTGIRYYNFQTFVFFILIPPLVFESALNIRLSVLRPLLGTILFSATAGVLLAAGSAAVVLYYSINHPDGFPWLAALLTGLVISATDPVAVVAKLRESGAAAELATLLEGESLFNDATVIVLFGVLLAMAGNAAQASIVSGTGLFLWVLTGGLLVGAVLGAVAKLLLALLPPSSESRMLLGLTVAYGSFYVAEHLLHVSGVMAVLLAALLLQRTLLSDQSSRDEIRKSWELLAFIGNIVVFFLLGLVVTFDMFIEQWLAMLFGILAALLSRLLATVLAVSVGKYLFREPIPWNYTPVMLWGGLRGVITVALVLSLPLELEYWYTVQATGFGVVLFTLSVQALTVSGLLRALRLR